MKRAKQRVSKKKVSKKPATTKRAAGKPSAKKPAAKKPAAKQPAAKQPAAKQPAAKPADAKTADAKQPAEGKPVAKTASEKPGIQAAAPTPKKSAGKKAAKEAPKPAYELVDADFDRMWKMMDRVRREAAGNLTSSIAAFRRELGALDDEGVLRVGGAFNRTMARAYHNLLWGGAYVLHGGCSDDAFWDFRAGLIALGRDVYEAALVNPDTLADIEDVENLTLFEGFQYVPNEVAEARGLELTERQHLPKVAGDGFSDSELPTLFPKLTARFG